MNNQEKVLSIIKDLLLSSKKSYNQLESEIGISKSALQRYASGKTKKIPLDFVIKISKAFNVDTAYILGWENENKIDSVETLILQKFNILTEEEKYIILDLIDSLISNRANKTIKQKINK